MRKAQIKLSYNHYFKENIYHFLKKKHFGDKNINALLKNENVKVNGKTITNKNYELSFFKSRIEIVLNDESSFLPYYEDSLDIRYEDEYILIVNKPANMDIEPTKRNYENNLATRINYYFKNKNICSKIHFVNRLDKVTSGLVIIAKNQYIHNLFSNVKISKKYLATVEGKTKKNGIIKIKIKKDENSIKRIAAEDGKRCFTKYKRISYNNKTSLVQIKLLTGRTHQIRVSFAHINHPLVGDKLYNSNSDGTFNLCAYFLCFKHPIKKCKIKVELKS